MSNKNNLKDLITYNPKITKSKTIDEKYDIGFIGFPYD